MPAGEGARVAQRRFSRHVEDFECRSCGAAVSGDGYTNHCPICFWSRHVDVNPGDRAATCRGMMEPVALAQKRGELVLVHECRTCGLVRRNRTCPQDDREALLRLAAELARRAGGGPG
jgi:hypothetical protein